MTLQPRSCASRTKRVRGGLGMTSTAIMPDRKLANLWKLIDLARTFDQKARLCRQQEAEALARIDKPESAFIKEAYRQDIMRAAAAAEAWEARAAEAEAGYFLARVSEELNDAPRVRRCHDGLPGRGSGRLRLDGPGPADAAGQRRCPLRLNPRQARIGSRPPDRLREGGLTSPVHASA